MSYANEEIEVLKHDDFCKEKLHFERLCIDKYKRIVVREENEIELTYTEFEILLLLARNAGMAFSKEQIYDSVWKEPYFGNENVLNTHINRLRLKLKSNAEDSTAYVKTLWGIGYKMEEK